MNELYNGMALQTGYDHHTSYWDDKVEAKAQSLAGQMHWAQEEHPELFSEEPVPNKKTVDLNDLYNGMALQTGYEHHSSFYHNRVEEETLKLEKEMRAEEMQKEQNHRAQVIKDFGMMNEEPNTKNPSVNFAQMYKDLIQKSSFVQLSDHDNDSDDLVPEYSEAVKIEPKKEEKLKKKIDFNGAEFEEFYDE